MENHPIPQDITGFQFKLIGDMTVKQFAYIAVGVLIGWLFYITPLSDLIKIPLAVSFIAFGVALAFVPVQGRPLDTMIANFFKAVFSPTQYIYQKQGANLSMQNSPTSDNPQSQDQQFRQFLNKFQKPKNKLDQKESVFFQSLATASTPLVGKTITQENIQSHTFANQAPTRQVNMPKPQPPKAPDEVLSSENLLKTAAVLEKELTKAKEVEAKEAHVDPGAFLETHQKVLELQEKLNEMLSQKQDLEKRLVEMQKTAGQSQGPVFSPSVAKETPREQTQYVRSIPQNLTRSVGLPTTPEFPNLLTGIVKDPRGNPLGNILVEVKDAEGNAVRAFKTNALGHFASATALNNGKYTIMFEDIKNQHRFDTIGFEANGEVIMPIEVISVDSREELRRSLFN
ncbi:MAG: PrgI family protein [Patescibacteria group bacterium]